MCVTGFVTEKKISELLEGSLPRKIDLEIIPYNYQQLVENGNRDSIFNRYQVELIVGTLDPKVSGIPFMAIESVMMNDEIGVLEQLMQRYLGAVDLEAFNQNITKNFTLSNIVNHLTILNGEKIIDDVEEIVENLEEDLNEELAAEGFTITKWGSGGVFYWLTRICVQIHIELLRLTRTILNNQFLRHAEGRWLELKAADFSKFRKAATRTQGYVTLIRSDYGQALIITKGHMFKTAPDINGDELVYYALEDTVIQAGQAEGSVLVEAEAAGARYNVSEDQIRVSMLYMEGVSQVTNRQGWIYSEGADEESEAGLRSRTLASWEELSTNTTSAKLKAAVEAIPGVMCAYIDDQHPRGQGTVDVIVVGTAGEASGELVRKAQEAADQLKDNYEDYLAKSGTITYQDVDITLYLKQGAGVTDVEETARSLIAGAMSLSNRTDFNLFLQDDIRYVLRQSIPDYRKTVFTAPAVDVELTAGNVVMLGSITVKVKNT